MPGTGLVNGPGPRDEVGPAALRSFPFAC